MKLQSLTIIFIIIVLPVSLVLSSYIGYELKTIEKQNMYNSGIIKATHDAVFSFEINTNSDNYSNNPESKRDIIKSSVKTFENSLSTTCNLGLYGNSSIEEYIPAMVFGMYDGFYMYSPYNTKDGYKHELRNYVYYSEILPDSDIVIRYSLDNYIAVSGTFNGKYITKAGYLTDFTKFNTGAPIGQNFGLKNGNLTLYSKENLKYKEYDSNNKKIVEKEEKDGSANSDAINYYNETIRFSNWVQINLIDKAPYLKVGNNKGEDPELSDSNFEQHKRKIIREKIQSILNSSITAYKNKSGNSYKMPIFSEEDWKKIYSNISVISFVQGMNLGFKKYNSYCILNSTNNNEYVNPYLIYYSDGNEYHSIGCTSAKNLDHLVGYKIGDFEKTKVEVYKDGNLDKTEEVYYYKHDETACYDCINGGHTYIGSKLYDYMLGSGVPEWRRAYFLAVARVRKNTTKLSDRLNIRYQ